MVMEVVEVFHKELQVGAVSYDVENRVGVFEYAPEFIKTGIQLSPLKMPLAKGLYRFANLDYDTFKGLPGLLADSLPDDFGNSILNAWVASEGRSVSDITPLQRLSYTGQRGMGALTYKPTKVKALRGVENIQIDALVKVAQDVLESRNNFEADVGPVGEENKEAMLQLMSVGMSAGGARPKAVVAFNGDFTQARSGQTDAPEGFNHYLMKFDGVSEHNKNKETFGDPIGFGAGEYVYYLMATRCGIDMSYSTLLNEGSRRHFITQRFDRVGNERVHVQTLNGLAHVSFKKAGSYSYEELIGIARQLRLSSSDALQLFKRMVFNVVARNHDDHSKNTSFMHNEHNQWVLAPAYDLAYSYRPGSPWVNSHWMTVNGKREDFERNDFYAFEKLSPIFSRKRINEILDETIEHVSRWQELAKDNDVPKTLIDEVRSNLRLHL
ncbi:type II toxin-antitoxin system HipA family toxin [Pseudoalteromonas marina]|uniref:Type II toxin-antitoxin system HipA family toxin n=1 Tax=Pseudoalteromonas marina TaxID=267375 RepID=A0ABT9FCK3_9GAMM|nr:type II toxin-antitoxin system HipA family toxin [Pseudoalteromonas marina]MDP2564468.1 type II toxin-antitoxin system HipA family toxin [Pseudoalteromonas marina]